MNKATQLQATRPALASENRVPNDRPAPDSKPPRSGRFTGGINESNELVRGMGLKPLKGRLGPRLAY